MIIGVKGKKIVHGETCTCTDAMKCPYWCEQVGSMKAGMLPNVSYEGLSNDLAEIEASDSRPDVRPKGHRPED